MRYWAGWPVGIRRTRLLLQPRYVRSGHTSTRRLIVAYLGLRLRWLQILVSLIMFMVPSFPFNPGMQNVALVHKKLQDHPIRPATCHMPDAKEQGT